MSQDTRYTMKVNSTNGINETVSIDGSMWKRRWRLHGGCTFELDRRFDSLLFSYFLIHGLWPRVLKKIVGTVWWCKYDYDGSTDLVTGDALTQNYDHLVNRINWWNRSSPNFKSRIEHALSALENLLQHFDCTVSSDMYFFNKKTLFTPLDTDSFYYIEIIGP